MKDFKQALEDRLARRAADEFDSMTEAEQDALLPANFTIPDDADSQAWTALCDLLMIVGRDERIRASPRVRDFLYVVTRIAADYPAQGAEFDDVGALVRSKMARADIRRREDQRDKEAFQDWLRASGIRVDRISDLEDLPAYAVPERVRDVIGRRDKETLRAWYKAIHPGPMMPGRKKT